MAKNMHKEEFDEGTKIKLEILKKYLAGWFPVALNSTKDTIKVFDFFAGSGTDASGEPGSPLIILEYFIGQCSLLKLKGVSTEIVFNDIAVEI